MPLGKGVRVRLKGDPNHIGTCTGRIRESGGRDVYQVDFAGRMQYEPEVHLEEVGEATEHPLDLLERGLLGRVADLRRILTAVRLSGKLADLIYSMEITNTDFYAYQFKPVLKMLNSPSNGILIADEVGLGKTIEAGLIWTELRSRYDLRRLMVLCPAMLQEKWQKELRRRFGINAAIVDAKMTLAALSGTDRENESGSFAIIASLQGLRPPRGWDSDEDRKRGAASRLARLLEERKGEESIVDLLVIDEAHYLRNPESQTAKLGRLLRDVSEHVALLSATPIHLKSGDLFQLMNVIDEDTFNHPFSFDEILSANKPLVELRDHVLSASPDEGRIRDLVHQALQHRLLVDSRQLRSLEKIIPSQEDIADPDTRSELACRLESINLMSNVVTRTRKRDVHERRVVREPICIEVPLTPLEREFYDKVTAIVRKFCQKRAVSEGFLLSTPQRQMSSCMPAALRVWQKRGYTAREYGIEDYDYMDTEEVFDERPLVGALAAEAGRLGSPKDLELHDSKYHALVECLLQILKANRSEKVILFSYFKATLAYLEERLSSEGISTVVLSGDSGHEKGRILDEFESAAGPNVLLSSEIGSEGIDLQFSRVVINYDLPWNPMRVEQRIGRVDRIGQRAEKVRIINLIYDETIDSRIYGRLFEVAPVGWTVWRRK